MAQQSVVDIAKAQVIAYNEKNWDKVKAGVAPGLVYDELGTQRKVEGVDKVIDIWKGWAAAMPDSKATFNSEVVSGNTVVLEMTWRGTHKGPLKTSTGEIPATGKNFELRACQVVEVSNDKVKSVRHYFDMGSLLRQLGVEH
ncbi:MAG: ester cyclase [Thermoanaerobaculia bacterium]